MAIAHTPLSHCHRGTTEPGITMMIGMKHYKSIVSSYLSFAFSGRKGPRMRNSRRRDDYPDKPPVSYLPSLFTVRHYCVLCSCALCSVSKINIYKKLISSHRSFLRWSLNLPVMVVLHRTAARLAEVIHIDNLIRIVTISSIVPIIIL